MKKLLLFSAFLLLVGYVFSQGGESLAIKGVLVKKTQPLRSFIQPDASALYKVFGEDGKRIWPDGIAKPHYDFPVNPLSENYTDPALQQTVPQNTNIGGANTAAIITGIEGLATGVQPMDPTICVGNNHVIELVNALPSTKMKIWDKNGTVVVNEVVLQSLTGFPGFGDPIALYDQLSDRYIVTEFLIKGYNGSVENGMSMMVSQTGDPTGSWYVYKWVIPEDFTLDYPKWAVWSDGIYMHTNNFSQTTGSYQSSYFAVFNKDDMYSGAATFRSIRITQSIGNGYATCPAQLQGSTVPAGGQLFITENNSNQATVIACNTNWTTSSMTQSTAANITLTSFNETVCSATRFACATQPSGGSSVEVLSFRIMNQPIYRVLPSYNGLVFCFTVNAGSNTAGIRWVELKNTGSGWTKNQESTWHPNTNHHFMPSMAYDANGNIALAYSTSSTSTYLGVRYTARKTCDPLGQMTLAESVLKDGNAISSGSRWGDYNHLLADPNVNNLWMVSMYGKSGASGGKGSYITQFRVSPCLNGKCDTATGLAASNITTYSATVSWNTGLKATSYTVEYKASAASTWTYAAAASPSTSINITGLAPNTLYDWRVFTNCSGSTSYGRSQFTTMAVICNAPTGLSSSAITSSSATVSWGAVNGVNNYTVEYKTSASGTWTTAASATTATSQNIAGLSSGTVYDWRVRSNCAGGSSAYTAAQFTTSTPACPGAYDVSTNGTRGGAATVPFNSDIKGLISPSSDNDYYKFVISTAGTITLTLTTLPADYNLKLYRNNSNIATSASTGNADESISGSVPTGTYYARVYGYNGANNATVCYTLKVEPGTASFSSSESIVANKNSHIKISPNPVTDLLNINLGDNNETAVVSVFDSYGKQVIRQQMRQTGAIKMGSLASGVYAVSVTNLKGEQITRQKIVKH